LWLLGRESKPVVDRAVEARERYFEHEPLDPVEWSYAVVDYLESERCDLIEKRGRQAKAARGGLIEVDAALAACSDTERERLSAAADSVLKKRSGEWLGKGNFDQFAKWVRVASKTKAGSPRDALRNSMHTVLP
jgi:hypothetical protein